MPTSSLTRCFIEHRVISSNNHCSVFHKSIISFVFAAVLCAQAQEPARGDDSAAASLAAYEKGDHSAERIALLLPQLADPTRRNVVRTRLRDPLPAAELAALLKHNSLAV